MKSITPAPGHQSLRAHATRNLFYFLYECFVHSFYFFNLGLNLGAVPLMGRQSRCTYPVWVFAFFFVVCCITNLYCIPLEEHPIKVHKKLSRLHHQATSAQHLTMNSRVSLNDAIRKLRLVLSLPTLKPYFSHRKQFYLVSSQSVWGAYIILSICLCFCPRRWLVRSLTIEQFGSKIFLIFLRMSTPLAIIKQCLAPSFDKNSNRHHDFPCFS